MMTTEVYGRMDLAVPDGADRAEVTLPDGTLQAAIPYEHHEADFAYDRHGYETVTLTGQKQCQVSFTATAPGLHTLRAYHRDQVLHTQAFAAVDAGLPGFVTVSARDPRYFVTSNGAPYLPIGPNAITADYDRLPAGYEHFMTSDRLATTGLIQWRRWFGEMQRAGANYTRIWLSSRYTQARTELMGVHDPVALARFEAVVALARAHGIRLKLCLEHWRTFTDESAFTYRRYVDPDTGRQLIDEERWFNDPVWNDRWIKDIMPYLARCQNDPVVFAWELWNEIDCGRAGLETVARFTERMIPEIKQISPRNLVVNSLGSLDGERKQLRQDRFRFMKEMDFQQVHRYLDQGAEMEICHTDPVAFSLDAVARARCEGKPIILTETGAVNDSHTGPFRFYACDNLGLIFHDVTYPAIFAGAAGSGHIWHWNSYVEQKNLWRFYRPLVDAFTGIEVDAEAFVSGVMENDQAWLLTLIGKKHTLLYVRSRADRWDAVLRDGIAPTPIERMLLPIKAVDARAHWLCDEQPGEPRIEASGVRLPTFVHGCVLVLTNPDKT